MLIAVGVYQYKMLKHEYWRGVQDTLCLQAAPVLEFTDNFSSNPASSGEKSASPQGKQNRFVVCLEITVLGNRTDAAMNFELLQAPQSHRRQTRLHMDHRWHDEYAVVVWRRNRSATINCDEIAALGQNR